MSEHIFGQNQRLDDHLLDEKSKKGLDVQGGISTQEIDHDQVCQEFASLLGVTKMDRHWKVFMMLRFSGLDFVNALEFAQIHGFLHGVRVPEAVMIEAAALAKLKETLSGQGIAAVVDKFKTQTGQKTDLPINIAVPDNTGTPTTGEIPCQN